MNYHAHPPKQHPKQQQRQLKEVLQDPDASWSEIRQAMKSSSRGCTNVAIMGAIASAGMGSVVTPVTTEVIQSVDSGIVATDRAGAGRAGAGAATESYCDSTKKHVPSKDNNNNATTTARRPARRFGGLRRKKSSSSRRRLMGGGLKSSLVSRTDSIDMMDFGVEDGMGSSSSDVIRRGGSGRLCNTNNRRRCGDDDDDDDDNDISVASDGCLAWDHGDDDDDDDDDAYSDVHSSFRSSSSRSAFLDWNGNVSIPQLDPQPDPGPADPPTRVYIGTTTSNNGIAGSSLPSYSDLVDSSGFLGWDTSRSNKGQQQGLSSPRDNEQFDTFAPTRVHKVNGLTKGRRQFAASESSSLTNRNKEHNWNIEDYEDPLDDSVATLPSTRSCRRGNFFANQLKRYNAERNCNTATSAIIANAATKEDINLGNIKEALKKVSRSTSDEVDESKDKSTSWRQNTNRRKTIMGMPSFLGGGGGSDSNAGMDGNSHRDAANTNDRARTISRDAGSQPSTAPSSDGSENKRSATSTGATSANTTTTRSHFGSFLWNQGSQERHNQQHGCGDDLREAIWINRKDGDVDIAKERRKLLCRSTSTYEERKRHRNGRRASLLGLERPMRSSSENAIDFD